MSRIIMIVPPLSGHINPSLSIGYELIQRGHEVIWISVYNMVVPEGGKIMTLDGMIDQGAAARILQNAEKRNDTTSGIVSVQFVYEDILIPLAKIMMPGLVNIMKTIVPDIVVADQYAFAGALACHAIGIPFTTVNVIPANLLEKVFPGVHQWISTQTLQLQVELGLAAERDLLLSDNLVLNLSSLELTGQTDIPYPHQFVGPVIYNRPITSGFDFSQLGDDPVILVSIGTIDRKDKDAFFYKVVEAFRDEAVQVIAVVDPRILPSWPENFIVQEQVPQVELLPYLKAVVCHGGHNTVCEALSHGLPLIILPIAFDQFHVATQVVEAGAGVRLKFKRFNAIQLRVSLYEVLENPAYRIEAHRLGESLKKAGGALRAADLIEELIVNHVKQ